MNAYVSEFALVPYSCRLILARPPVLLRDKLSFQQVAPILQLEGPSCTG